MRGKQTHQTRTGYALDSTFDYSPQGGIPSFRDASFGFSSFAGSLAFRSGRATFVKQPLDFIEHVGGNNLPSNDRINFPRHFLPGCGDLRRNGLRFEPAFFHGLHSFIIFLAAARTNLFSGFFGGL